MPDEFSVTAFIKYYQISKTLDSFYKTRVVSFLADYKCGGASVLVNGAVFKTVCETVRAGSGGFDSHTPPPN